MIVCVARSNIFTDAILDGGLLDDEKRAEEGTRTAMKRVLQDVVKRLGDVHHRFTRTHTTHTHTHTHSILPNVHQQVSVFTIYPVLFASLQLARCVCVYVCSFRRLHSSKYDETLLRELITRTMALIECFFRTRSITALAKFAGCKKKSASLGLLGTYHALTHRRTHSRARIHTFIHTDTTHTDTHMFIFTRTQRKKKKRMKRSTIQQIRFGRGKRRGIRRRGR